MDGEGWDVVESDGWSKLCQGVWEGEVWWEVVGRYMRMCEA